VERDTRRMANGIMYIPRRDTVLYPLRMSAGRVMGWTFFVSSLFWPRLYIVGYWIFGTQLGPAFGSWLIPAVGFVIAPWTVVSYSFMWGISSRAVSGWQWLVVAVGVLLDVLTTLGGRALIRP